MPKVSEDYRESRRDQIIDAAITCFLRRGIRATTMAQIIAESRLSSGAIYGYFDSKKALALAAVRREGAGRAADIEAASAIEPIPPSAILRAIDDALVNQPVAPAIIVQMWGEATSDADFADVTVSAFDELTRAFREPLLRWFTTRKGLDIDTAQHRVETALPTMLALTQGLVLQKTVMPDFDRERFLGGIDELFDS